MRIGIFLKQNLQRTMARLRRAFSMRRSLAAYRALSRKERIFFSGAIILIVIGIIGGIITLYLRMTYPAPAYGGTITEGVVGKPFAIHPFIPDSSPADGILEQLIFSSLLKPDSKGGLIADLVEEYEVLEGGKVYVISLKPDLKWHDGYPVTAEDILFTIQLIKNPEANHPLYNLFRDIDAKVLTPRSVTLTLPRAFSFFPQYLTFKIIPKHIWGTVPIQNFPFSEYSLKPIGSGPYVFKKIVSTKDGNPLEYLLGASPSYYLPGPYLQSFSIRFFSSIDEAMNALRKKEIDSVADVAANTTSHDAPGNFETITPVIPQSFGVFFNLEVAPLNDKVMRQAIRAALPVESFFATNPLDTTTRIDSPIWFIAPSPYPFNTEQSETLLASLGWKDTDNDGIKDKKLQKKDKIATPLELSLTVLDTPDMQTLGSRIQEEFKKVGIRIILKNVDINEFHSRLRSNSFQLLVVGELPTSGYYPDLYPFFHSTQKPPQGMNFSSYTDKQIDKTLVSLRGSMDPETRDLRYQEIAEAIRDDVPAIFLYRPVWTWLIQKSIKVPAVQFLNSGDERLSRVNEWYIFTKRIWK